VDLAGWGAIMAIDGDTLELVDLRVLLHRPAWHTDAACRGMGPGPWFPGLGGDTRVAKSVCATCPVQGPCAEASLGEVGIWAGGSAIRRTIARLGREFPDVRAGVTGGPAISNDEMVTAFDDSKTATLLAFGFTMALLLAAVLSVLETSW